jgi:gliding motility-associated-like protein
MLGCNDAGADGIAFVLQPISTSVGGNGSGMGFGGISPSVGVTLDTYQNSSPDSDPFYDHIAVQLNGDVNHLSSNTITPLTAISATNDNVEDCIVHSLRIAWNAATTNLIISFDGQQRLNVTRDFVTTVFGGNPLVFWGFTGATGGLSNLQRFCTTLTPAFSFLPNQKKCVNEPITFYDNTTSFGGVVKHYWNFGDGSNIDSVNLNPTHTYTTAGDFVVVQRVKGADGCEETNTQTVRIGSKPVAGFYHQDSCINTLVHFFDTSTVAVGTLTSIFWELDNSGLTSIVSNPTSTYSTAGIKNIKLVVKSLEGCTSDTLYKPIRIFDRPVVNFSFTDSVCLGSPIIFTDNSTVSNGTVNGWVWLIDNVNATNNTSTLTHTFLTPGNHSISLMTTATGNSDCMGNMVTKNIYIRPKPVAAVKRLTICPGQTVNLLDSSYVPGGGQITQWWWDLGNNQYSTQQNPPVIYNSAGQANLQLVVSSAGGCKSDTLKFTLVVSAKPVANFGYPVTLCEGMPVQFTDSSSISGASIIKWRWTDNTILMDSVRNPVRILPAGTHSISLVVTSSDGCISDPFAQTLTVLYRPLIKWNFDDDCKNALISFSATDSLPGSVNSWHWNFGDGVAGTGNPATHSYSSNGAYPVTLYGETSTGCPHTDTLKGTINIYGTNAFAGNDVIAAEMQPVQLNAIGGISYEWSPGFGLTATDISNPVATVPSDQVYYLKAYTPEGCESFDTIKIKIYKGPDIYLPTAFTPNGDGLNDIFRGILVGIKTFNFLKVYNRWGQEIFITSDVSSGWNGKWKGKEQETGVYVVMASGIDFTGKLITKKSTVLLIR